jgi:methylenetetrahydrofolate reductase (NADPH)
MPIANAKQVLRMAQMSGASVPADLEQALLQASDDSQARAIGMDFTVKLVEELKQLGAPGIHIFTLNHHLAALELVHEAQLA